MLILKFIIIFLTHLMSGCVCLQTVTVFETRRHDPHNGQNRAVSDENVPDVDNFYVEIQRDLFSKLTPLEYSKNATYNYDIGDTLTLTCHNKVSARNVSLQWSDQNGFKTPPLVPDMTNKDVPLRLIIQPDKNDTNVTLICISITDQDVRMIAIELKTYNPNNNKLTVPLESKIKYLEKGVPLMTPCNGVVYLPNKNSPSIFHPLVNILSKFTEEFNGTVIYCFKYEHYEFNDHKQITTYERKKNKITIYIKDEMTANDAIKRINGNQLQADKSVYENNHQTQETNTESVKIVGGALGFIILLLLTVIILMWYRKTKRRRLLDNEEYVVYAEIAERPQPPQLPPPRRHDPPYAVIAGILVPTQPPGNKTQPTSLIEDDHTCLYSIVNK